MNTLKSSSTNTFLNDLVKNQIKNIQVYENILLGSKSAVKDGKKSIIKTIKAVKVSLIKRLDKFIEYTRLKKEDLKEDQISKSIDSNNNIVNQFQFEKIVNYLKFLEEEINYLEGVTDTIVFKRITGDKKKKSDHPKNRKQKKNFLAKKTNSYKYKNRNNVNDNNKNIEADIIDVHEKHSVDDSEILKSTKSNKKFLSNSLKIKKKIKKYAKRKQMNNDENIDNYKMNKPSQDSAETMSELLEKLHMAFVFEKNSEYVLSNLKRLINTHIIYRSEFTMKDFNSPTIFESNFLTDDVHLKENLRKFENVQVIILKKENLNLSGVIKSLENFFKYFIRRVDENKNQMFRGVLKCDFEIFENYFKNKYKAFKSIDVLQIDVFLFRFDLFSDYNEFTDRTNLHRYEMDILQEQCRVFEKIRKAYIHNQI